MFFIAAALVLTTAGVFAGKSKFFDSVTVYAYNATSHTGVTILASSTSLTNITTTQSGSQASILDENGASYLLYTNSGLGTKLYFNF